jgi:hypothetical protein
VTDDTNSIVFGSVEDGVTRRCSCCKHVKLLNDFYFSKIEKYGRKYECKVCSRLKDRRRTLRARIKREEEASAILRPEGYVSRKDAQDVGQTWYFTGKPCRYGHISKRTVSSHGCQKCALEKYYAKSTKPRKQWLTKLEDGTYTGIPCRVCGDMRRNKRKNCPTCLVGIIERGKARHDQMRRHRKAKNPEKIKSMLNAAVRKYRKENPHVGARRRITVIQATPKWLTDKDKEKIRLFYKNRPKGFHVDHILPIQSPLVCGLHIPINLQYLSAYENASKGNKFPYCDEQLRLAPDLD